MARDRSRAIHAELLCEIRAGVFAPLSRFPSEAELADRFGVSREMIRGIKAALAHDGLITSKQGSGTYVTAPGCTARYRTGVVVCAPAYYDAVQSLMPSLSRRARERDVELCAEYVCDNRPAEMLSRMQSAIRRLVAVGARSVACQMKADSFFGREAAASIISMSRSAGVDVVMFGDTLSSAGASSGCDCVGMDAFDVGRLTGEHAVSIGARRVCIVHPHSFDDDAALLAAGADFARPGQSAVANISAEFAYVAKAVDEPTLRETSGMCVLCGFDELPPSRGGASGEWREVTQDCCSLQARIRSFPKTGGCTMFQVLPDRRRVTQAAVELAVNRIFHPGRQNVSIGVPPRCLVRSRCADAK